MSLSPLKLTIEGSWEPINEPNKRWKGEISSTDRFATLILVSTPELVYWAKAEVCHSPIPIVLDVHPTIGKQVQYIFIVGSAWVGDCVANLPTPGTLPVPSFSTQIGAGTQYTVFTVVSDPPVIFKVLFLAASDVYKGRKGIWRPHEDITPELPPSLIPIVRSGRTGYTTV